MNPIRISFLLATALALAACSNEATIIIENASDNPEMTIRYTLPTRYANEMVLMDTLSGTSELRFRVEALRHHFVCVQQIPDFKGMVTFPVGRGETYRLRFDGKSFSFSAPGQDVQRYYANIPYYSHTQLEARNYARIKDLSQARESLDSTMKSQMAPFDSLLQIKKISPGMYDLVAADRECNTLAVWGQVGVLREDDTIRDAIYETTDLDNDRLAQSPKYYGLMEDYANWKIVKNLENLLPRIQAGERYTLMMEAYKEVLSGGRLEAVYAWQWLYAAIQRQYEKELISLFESFKQDYPNSPYLRALQPYYQDILAYYTPKETSADVHFMEETDDIATFKELLSRFAGQKVYVDVWATWCGPCKDEFAFEDTLHELLEEKGYKMLYLSLDEERDAQEWKDMAAFYNLRGDHVRAGEKLTEDLRELYGQNGAMVIPWNMIIDESGHIVKLHAPRPSDMEELSKALDH